jgi:DeoR/GlpR family transcriptional regulator of sugar metabolism
MSTWSFVTNHGGVLILVAKRPQITAREIAAHLGITERSVLRIISDLEAEGYLTRTRDGRVNTYKVNPDLPLRRPELREVLVGELLNALAFQTLEEKASPENKLALNDGI